MRFVPLYNGIKDDKRRGRLSVSNVLNLSIVRRSVSNMRLMGTIKGNARVLPKYRDIKTSLLPRIKLFNTFPFMTCRLFMKPIWAICDTSYVSKCGIVRSPIFNNIRASAVSGATLSLIIKKLTKLASETIKRRGFYNETFSVTRYSLVKIH